MERARYVSFAGAGTRGVVYAGVIDAWEARLADFEVWRQGLRGAAGTSAGAIAALGLLLGLPRADRHELMRAMADMREVVQFPDVSLLLRHFGWADGHALRGQVSEMLERGGLSPNSTFADLRRLLRQEFVCVCTDLRTGEAVRLCADATPGMRVCDAVYASCCVPFVFTPPCLPDGRMVTDGCLSCNQPDVFVRAETLFVTVDWSVPARVESWPDFLGGIARAALAAQQPWWDALVREDALRLEVRLPPDADFPSIDLELSPRSFALLTAAGYAAAHDALAGGALAAGVAAALRVWLRLHAAAACESGVLSEECPPVAGDTAACPAAA